MNSPSDQDFELAINTFDSPQPFGELILREGRFPPGPEPGEIFRKFATHLRQLFLPEGLRRNTYIMLQQVDHGLYRDGFPKLEGLRPNAYTRLCVHEDNVAGKLSGQLYHSELGDVFTLLFDGGEDEFMILLVQPPIDVDYFKRWLLWDGCKRASGPLLGAVRLFAGING